MLIAAGFLCFLLGAIGLILPVWPTTPLWLAAAGFFGSSPKIRARMQRIPVFRDFLANYHTRQGLPKKTVWFSLVFLWAALLLSMLLVKALWLSILLVGIGGAVTLHILLIARPKN